MGDFHVYEPRRKIILGSYVGEGDALIMPGKEILIKLSAPCIKVCAGLVCASLRLKHP